MPYERLPTVKRVRGGKLSGPRYTRVMRDEGGRRALCATGSLSYTRVVYAQQDSFFSPYTRVVYAQQAPSLQYTRVVYVQQAPSHIPGWCIPSMPPYHTREVPTQHASLPYPRGIYPPWYPLGS